MNIFFIVNYIHRHEYIYLDILAYKKIKLFNYLDTYLKCITSLFLDKINLNF